MKKKYDYFVAVLNYDGTFSYITETEHLKKTFRCDDGYPAKRLSKEYAENLLEYLISNGYPAIIIKGYADSMYFTN